MGKQNEAKWGSKEGTKMNQWSSFDKSDEEMHKCIHEKRDSA